MMNVHPQNRSNDLYDEIFPIVTVRYCFSAQPLLTIIVAGEGWGDFGPASE
jgi:hypothetical protein